MKFSMCSGHINRSFGKAIIGGLRQSKQNGVEQKSQEIMHFSTNLIFENKNYNSLLTFCSRNMAYGFGFVHLCCKPHQMANCSNNLPR